MGKTKKICLFIVEGAADEYSLALPLQNIFDKYYKQKNVEFHITYGDVTSKNGITPQNIVSRIGKFVKDFLEKNHLQKKDICQVVQIVDMDGAFIEDSCVVYDATQKFPRYPFYDNDKIFVKSEEKISMLQTRNHQKVKNLNKIMSLSMIMTNIPYDVYYFSCNMDHVMQNEANMDDTKKVDEAEKFADNFKNNIDGFIEFIENAYPKNIIFNQKASWDYIEMGNNSLTRCSNFILFFYANKFNSNLSTEKNIIK